MNSKVDDELLDFPVERTSPFSMPEIYETLQKEQPFCRVRNRIDGTEPWLITRYEDCREVLINTAVSADPTVEGYPQLSAGHAATARRPGDFVYMDDPEHARFRGYIAREFLVREVSALKPDIEWIIDHLADQMLEKGPPLDLVTEFALAVPSMVICKILGVSYENHELFQTTAQTRLKIDNTVEDTVDSLERLFAYLNQIVSEKERKPTDDLLSRLAAHINTGEVTHEEVVNISRLLISAGHETTANLITLGTVLLITHPDQFSALMNNPELAPQATEEILRYTSIVHATPRRTALEDIEVNGHRIRKGEGIVPLTAVANRDPSVFEEPNRFNIHRKEAKRHLAFNYGPHFCLGANLARLEMQIVMERFYPRFLNLDIAVPYDEIDFKLDSFMLGAHSLPVKWEE